MIFVIATAQVKPDKRDAFMQGVQACLAETLKEQGCLRYDCNASVSEPTRFVFVEQWESRDALMAHARSDHLRAWRKLSADFVAGPTVVEIIEPAKVDVM